MQANHQPEKQYYMSYSKYWGQARVIFTLVASLFVYDVSCATPNSEFAGKDVCASCHQEAYQSWQHSHHDLAMQEATPNSVLGNFDNQTFTYFDVTSTFTKKDQKYFVKTDGPDGKPTSYEIAFVFGVYPLQQYLIEFPGGRYQSLSIAWDSRTKEEGGQRWFHLYPDEKISHESPLHWTGLDQNWNYMCAECHSTNLKKNFYQDADQFKTTWSEINVSCEACHGPGQDHVDWAQRTPEERKNTNNGFKLTLENSAAWVINPETGLASREPARSNKLEVEMCARCHSRRSIQSEDYVYGRPLLDTHIPAILSEQLYHSDGQIDDEVYVYGSFLQSKMYQKGVTCSDCHNPHTLQLKAEGNQLCGSCHLATRFDSPDHHFHTEDTGGAKCVSCHMPEKNYMVIDARGDHSFRIPRPDLSLKLGTPNACTQCHKDQNDEWAASAVEKWYPASQRRKEIHYAEVLSAGRKGSADANQLLIDLAKNGSQPAIVRATAASQLQSYLNPLTLTAVNDLLHDEKILVRFNAISVVEGLPPEVKVKLLSHLLDDDIRMVRLEAARVLADSRVQIADASVRQKLDQTIEAYVAAVSINAERPEAHVNLGNLYLSMQKVEHAQAEYEKAIALDPTFISAYVNLADLYRARNMDNEGKRYLLSAIEKEPNAGAPYYALGLLYVRQNKLSDALSALHTAVELEADNVRYKYVYAIALESSGQLEKALQILMLAHEQRLADRDVLYALISFHQKSGNTEQAKHFAGVLLEISPWDQNAKALYNRL